MIARRDVLLMGAVGAAAALAGALGGAFLLQTESGAAELLASRYPGMDGGEHRLLDWRGKLLLCNFWATWCAPCREEVPLLVAAKREWGTKGLEIVGIGLDSGDKIRDFAREYRVNYPLLIADGGAIGLMRKIGNSAGGLPYTVGLDRAGTIRERHVGALKEHELRRLVVSLFR